MIGLVLLVACTGDPGRTPLPDDSSPAIETGDSWRDSGDPPDDTGDSGEPAASAPAVYSSGRLQSSITAWVQQRLQEIVSGPGTGSPTVFMKVGDSITVDSNALHCFSGSHVDLGGRGDLRPSMEHFLAGDAAGTTPFDRSSLAAQGGMSATWATSGDPSPLDQELAAIDPAFAVLQYGTNDMHLGTSFESAIWGFGNNMLDLVDAVLDADVAPMLLTIPPRADSSSADAWVPSYNAVIRGIAQGRQVPLVDLELGLRSVADWGLSSDGVHLNTHYDGGYRGCVLTAEGLDHGNNTRNLLILDGLDRLRRAALDGEVLDDSAAVLEGAGTGADPFVIDHFPFTDLRDTRDAGPSRIDVYDGCGADQDESGPEFFYGLELSQPTSLRAMVFDRGDVDIDLHLLDGEATGAACVERDDKILELDLQPGSWLLSLDSYVSSGTARSGEYLLVVVEI